MDIKAKGQGGKRFNIEIQITDEADYEKRALYYWAKLYTEQLKTAEDYSTLSKAIGIHILNFTSILSNERYHNTFQIREKETNDLYFEDLELHTIELKKFCQHNNEELSDIVDKVKNALDMWGAFLTRNDLLQKDRLPSSLDNPELKKALTVLEVMSFGPEEREAYEEHLKWLRIETNTLKKYEAKGFREGKAEGEEIGEKRGRAEEKLLNAQKMLQEGIDNVIISKITGLSLLEIDSIK